MSLGGILLGVINIAIVAAVLVLIGAIIVMFAKWMNYSIDQNVQKLYLLVVLLIVLYMFVALLLGLPSVRIIGHAEGPPIGASRSPTPNIMVPETLGRRNN
jgi:hypothetical protein